MRGRAVELMTDNRKDRRRVRGVIGSESSSASSSRSTSPGVCGMLNRGRGRGAIAGVRVKAGVGVDEEMPGVRVTGEFPICRILFMG